MLPPPESNHQRTTHCSRCSRTNKDAPADSLGTLPGATTRTHTNRPRLLHKLLRIGLHARHLLRCRVNGFANPEVRRAPAEVARHRIVNLRIRRILMRLQQRRCRHDLPRLAISALRHLLLDPRLLHRMQPAFARACSYAPSCVIARSNRMRTAPELTRQPLDRRDLLASHIGYQRLARPHCLAFQMHCARAAHPNSAAVLGSRQRKLIAQRPEQRHRAIHIERPPLSIYLNHKLGHTSPPTPPYARHSPQSSPMQPISIPAQPTARAPQQSLTPLPSSQGLHKTLAQALPGDVLSILHNSLCPTPARSACKEKRPCPTGPKTNSAESRRRRPPHRPLPRRRHNLRHSHLDLVRRRRRRPLRPRLQRPEARAGTRPPCAKRQAVSSPPA